MQIEERLVRLEKENRRLKLMFLSLLLCIGLAFFLGAITKKEAKSQFFPQISTNRLSILDAGGKDNSWL
ncbi:MAG: hypothetical protein ACP5QS_02610 [bacterium]